MSIIGLGIDVVEVPSFAAQLDAPGSTFAAGTFTPGELAAGEHSIAVPRPSAGPGPGADSRPGADSIAAQRHRRLAGRFAAKEAFIKAFDGSRVGRAPALLPAHAERAEWSWADIEVRSDAWGRPTIELHGSVRQAVSAALGPVRIHVSLTHEESTAAAVVILEGES